MRHTVRLDESGYPVGKQEFVTTRTQDGKVASVLAPPMQNVSHVILEGIALNSVPPTVAELQHWTEIYGGTVIVV